MRAWQLSLVLLCGCGSGFAGERGRLEFETLLERQSLDWTPDQPVMLGARFGVLMTRREFCLVNCAGPALDGGRATGAFSLLGPMSVLAAREGEGTYEVTGADGDLFRARVQAPQVLTLHDPLVLNELEWDRYRVDAGGVRFPDVGEEVVVGEHAKVVLDVTPRSDGGVVLGAAKGDLLVRTSVGALRVGPRAADDRQVQLDTGDAGAAARIEASLPDGGLARAWAVRVAGVEEVAQLRLVPVSVLALPPHHYLVRALVTRADGGLFLEPPLSWQLPDGVRQVNYGEGATFGLTTRSDVVLFEYGGVDGGVVEVFARVGAHVAVADVAVAGRPLVEEEPPPPPPPSPRGCAAVPGELLAAALAALLLRRPPRA